MGERYLDKVEKARIAYIAARRHYEEIIEKYSLEIREVTEGQDIEGGQAITPEAAKEIKRANEDKKQKEKEFNDIWRARS